MSQKPAAMRERVKIANRFLADFGFAVITDAERVTFTRKPTGTDAAPFPKARLSLAFREDMARLVRGNEVLHERRIHQGCSGPHGNSAFQCQYPPSATWAAWLPSLDTMLFEWATSGAEHSDIVTVIEVWPLRSPGGRAIMPHRAALP